jgi:hypothetical protein
MKEKKGEWTRELDIQALDCPAFLVCLFAYGSLVDLELWSFWLSLPNAGITAVHSCALLFSLW